MSPRAYRRLPALRRGQPGRSDPPDARSRELAIEADVTDREQAGALASEAASASAAWISST
jgi:hypothetical protein